MGIKMTAARAALTLAAALPALDAALESTSQHGGQDRPVVRATNRPGFPAPARRAAALQVQTARVARAERARLLRAARALAVPAPPLVRSVGTVTMCLQVAALAKRLESTPRASSSLKATTDALRAVHASVTRFTGGADPEPRIVPAADKVAEAAAELRRRATFLTTGKAAQRAGVTASSIRVAVHRGRLQVAGGRAGHPLYDPADVDALWPPVAAQPDVAESLTAA